MKARDLLRAVERYAKAKPTHDALLDLDDEQLKTATYVAAELFRTLRHEAVRRGVWDDMIAPLNERLKKVEP